MSGLPREAGLMCAKALRARALRSPLLDLVGPAAYVDVQSATDSTVQHGWEYYWKSTHLPELSDELIDVIAGHAFACSSPMSYVLLLNPTGAGSAGDRVDARWVVGGVCSPRWTWACSDC